MPIQVTRPNFRESQSICSSENIRVKLKTPGERQSMPPPCSLTEFVLDLDELESGFSRITPSRGAAWAEAAKVCLESEGHESGVELQRISGNRYVLRWSRKPECATDSWADDAEATEDGATAVAVLMARHETGHPDIRRMYGGHGFDYWCGVYSESTGFSNQERLEISGIRSGTRSQVRTRVRQKLTQAHSDLRLAGYPAIAIVIEFSEPIAMVNRSCP